MQIHRRYLVALVAGALLSGWLGVLLNRVTGQDGMEGVGSLVWLLLPVLLPVAVAPRRAGSALGSSFRPGGRDTIAWYALSAAVLPVLAAAALGIGLATDRIELEGMSPARFVTDIAAALVPTLLKNIGEESVWRGLLTEELLRSGAPDAEIDLTVGLAWGLWHLPYYLDFLDDSTVQAVTGSDDRVRLATAGVLATATWAPLFTEVYARTRSVWPGVLMHTAGNVVQNALVTHRGVCIRPGAAPLHHPILGAVPAALTLGAALALRAARVRRRPVR